MSNANRELDFDTEQGQILDEAYQLGYHNVKNGCLQEPLRKINKWHRTNARVLAIDILTSLQHEGSPKNSYVEYAEIERMIKLLQEENDDE